MRNARMLLLFGLVVAWGSIIAGDEPAGQTSAEDVARQVIRDRLHTAIQEICPVSGNELGSHGAPIKVAVGEHKEEVFLCCKGCVKGQIDPRHWATIHANFARAQRICPVMGHELPKGAKWTIVAGRIVYVCCPPCTKKLAAQPALYLEKIDELYTASLKPVRQVQRQQIRTD